jgi:hypothetical protein
MAERTKRFLLPMEDFKKQEAPEPVEPGMKRSKEAGS